MNRVTIYFILIVILQITVQSQPILNKVSGYVQSPSLSTAEILELDELYTFKHKEGIIIYQKKEDSWQIYQYLQRFEDYGKIINIHKVKDVILITLEQKGVIISGGHEIKVDFSFHEASNHDGKVLALGIDNNLPPDRSVWYCENRSISNTISDILIFNPEKNSIDLKRLEKTMSGISSCTFWGGYFWLSVLCDGVESWNKGFYKIDLQGTITDFSLDDRFGEINQVHSNEGSLFLLSDDYFYKISDRDTSHHKVAFPDIIRHSVTTNNSVAYYMDKYPGNSRKFHIFQYNLVNSTCDTITIKNQYLKDWNYEYQVFEGSLFALPESFNKIDRVDLWNNNLISHYIIKSGINGHIDNMVEDDTEIWFISKETGLARYSKKDTSWMNIPLNLDLLSGSSCTLYFSELSINEDYVFVPLRDERSMNQAYVLYDRGTETMKQLSPEVFREMFFSYDGRFASYKNEPFAREKYSDTLKSFCDYLPEYHALLFLYNLPTSGSDVWNYRYKTISKDDYSIFSTIVLDYPPTWFKGAVIRYEDQRIKVVEFPNYVKNFNGSTLPYLITGNEFDIYVASQGRDDKGIFIYHVLEEEVESDILWHDTIESVSFIREVEDLVVIGSYEDQLFCFNRNTKDINNISQHISDFPMYFEKTDSYIYIGTYKELIYFDLNMNFLGKLFDGKSILHHTEYGLYLNTGNEVFRIVEE